MEALFDLIFGNLAFIIVIIGGVISFLKRANENQNNNRQNQNRKQTQTPIQAEDQKRYQPVKDKKVKPFIPQLDDLFGEITKHLEEQTQKQQPTVYQAETRKLDIEPIMEVKETKVVHDEKTKPRFEHVNKDTIVSKEIGHQTINMKKITKKKVVEGVIWGEILGPPRARKKHSYSYLKRG